MIATPSFATRRSCFRNPRGVCPSAACSSARRSEVCRLRIMRRRVAATITSREAGMADAQLYGSGAIQAGPSAGQTRPREAHHWPDITDPTLTRLPARCYKRLLCAEVCSLISGLYFDCTSFPTRPNRQSSFYYALAVEACSERVLTLAATVPTADAIHRRAATRPGKNPRHDP